MIQVRRALHSDAQGMADVLNPLIEDGSTTAIEQMMSGNDMIRYMARAPERSSWHVATDATGDVVGYQYAVPNTKLPPEAADIATFAHITQAGTGIGSRLFEATKSACFDLGYQWINASIRSDNVSGLRYYAKMGFQTYKTDATAALSTGYITGKTYKRFDL